MKAAPAVVLVCLSALLAFPGCNYVKPIMYIDIANHSGHPMQNLEVKHPTGTFGMPELRNEQTHRRLVPLGSPCQFSISFEDQTGKAYRQAYDLGAKCPMEIAFDIGAGMSISERVVRP
jgi:hypothetical protein